MTQAEIIVAIISSTVAVGFLIALLIVWLTDNNKSVIRSTEVYNGSKLVSTTYNTYAGKEIVRSETITY